MPPATDNDLQVIQYIPHANTMRTKQMIYQIFSINLSIYKSMYSNYLKEWILVSYA